jgi:rubredoxin
MWATNTENAKCPVCGTEYDPQELANDKGVDFEGAFFLAKAEFYCTKCKTKLNVEIDWSWRLVPEK